MLGLQNYCNGHKIDAKPIENKPTDNNCQTLCCYFISYLDRGCFGSNDLKIIQLTFQFEKGSMIYYNRVYTPKVFILKLRLSICI